MKKNILILNIIVFLFPIGLQAKPTQQEAKAFLDFYYKGQGQGTILADYKLCSENPKEADPVNECNNPAPTGSLVTGRDYYVWMAFVVPEGDRVEDLLINFDRNGVTRKTKEFSVNGSVRYRTWRVFKFDKPGKWTIRILHDNNAQIEKLGEINGVVTKGAE